MDSPSSASTPEGQGNLWICDRCQMIGSRDEARQHQTLVHPGSPMNSPTHELDQETSDAVRAIWREEQAKRVAVLGSFVR